MPIAPPLFTLVTPAAGVVVTGATVELVGIVTTSTGREVTSAAIDVSGMARPITISGTTWRVTIPLPGSLEATRSFTLSALDASGQTTMTMVQVAIDTLGPRTTLTQPAMGVAVGVTSLLQGTATDPATTTTVSVDVGAGPQPATIGAAGVWQAAVSFPANLNRVTRQITIRATDALGNLSSQVVQVLVDTQGPVLTLTSPSSTTVVGASATLAGAATDGTGPVSGMTVDVGSGPAPVTVQSNGTWSVMVTLPANLDRVMQTITLRAQDSLGNITQTTAQILVDTRGPVLVLTNPSSTTVVGTSATLTGTATDSTGPVSGMTVDVGGGPSPVTVQANGAWSATVTFPANLDRVLRTVTLRAQDAVGNVSQTTAQVLVDTRGPVLAFATPASMERLGIPRTQAVTGTVADGSGVSSVVMNCADLGGNRVATMTSGSWSVSWPLPTADNASFTCTTTATDSLTNQTVVTRTFFVDTVAPVVNITAPLAGAVLTSDAFTVQVTDGSNLLSATTATFAGLPASVTGSGTMYSGTLMRPSVDYESRTLSFTATDAEGNTNTVSRSVIVDTVAPHVFITTPSDGQVFNIASFTTSTHVDVSWTITDGDPAVGSRRFQGSPIPAILRTNAVATSPTDNGTIFNVTVDAVDTAGNVSNPAAVSFLVDRVAPTVTVSPSNGTRNSTAQTVRLAFSEPVIQRTVLNLNGVTSYGGSWTGQTIYDSDLLAGGSAYAAVTQNVQDINGNPGAPVSWQFHRAPTLPPTQSTIVSDAVGPWDVSSDEDGQPTVAFVLNQMSQPGRTMTLNGQTGSWVPASGDSGGLGLPTRVSYDDISINSWGAVDGALNLQRDRTVNASTGESVYLRDSWMTGVAQSFYAYLIPTPPISASDGTEWYGVVSGSQYTRSPSFSRNLPFAPKRLATFPNGWFGFALNGLGRLSVMAWACGAGGCDASPEMTSPESALGLRGVSAAVSSAGCGVVAYDTVVGRRAAVFNLSP